MDFELDLTDEEIDHLRRQAAAAGLSEHDYAVSAIRIYLRQPQPAEAATAARGVSAAGVDNERLREPAPEGP